MEVARVLAALAGWVLRRLAWMLAVILVVALAALGEHLFGGEPTFLLVLILAALVAIFVRLGRRRA